MITIKHNINTQPTIELVALSTVPAGKFVQFTEYYGSYGSSLKLTIEDSKSSMFGRAKGMVVKQLDNKKTLVFRITNTFGDDTAVEFSDCLVAVYDTRHTNIELALDFK